MFLTLKMRVFSALFLQGPSNSSSEKLAGMHLSLELVDTSIISRHW